MGLLNIDQNFNIVANYPKLITAKGNAAKAGTVLPIVVENNGNTVVEAHVMSAVFGTTSSQQLGIIKVVN